MAAARRVRYRNNRLGEQAVKKPVISAEAMRNEEILLRKVCKTPKFQNFPVISTGALQSNAERRNPAERGINCTCGISRLRYARNDGDLIAVYKEITL